MMWEDRLTRDLKTELDKIPLIDPHSHIDPRRAPARSLDEILGYHYYTELAHSAGMDKAPLAGHIEPRERVRAVLAHMNRFDNTAQFGWFLEIARTFLDFRGRRLSEQDCDALFDAAQRIMAQPDWEETVLRKTNVEKIFLTNDFDDSLEGFDANKYVPCLRTDDLVFHLDKAEVRDRLNRAVAMDVGDAAGLREALGKLFERFTRRAAKACAISLPPSFQPASVSDDEINRAFNADLANDAEQKAILARGVFWRLAEKCREFRLPFDLMIGVNRRVYREGVHQGQDLFDQRCSLIQYAELFNAFGDVTFPISVLSSGQNQELVSYSWIFPNVITNGHWWYSNIPAYIESDCRSRLQAVPKSKQIGYYSDAYKLEFILPKFNMYRSILAKILADDFVRTGIYSEQQAIDCGRLLLRDNSRRIFGV